MVQDVYGVQGMTCDHCVRAVTAEVGALPGVERVNVDLATGEVTVTSEDRLDPDAVSAAVEEAGYELVGRDQR
jgi:copper ion binding protein